MHALHHPYPQGTSPPHRCPKPRTTRSAPLASMPRIPPFDAPRTPPPIHARVASPVSPYTMTPSSRETPPPTSLQDRKLTASRARTDAIPHSRAIADSILFGGVRYFLVGRDWSARDEQLDTSKVEVNVDLGGCAIPCMFARVLTGYSQGWRHAWSGSW